jgi:hypothetical protein
VVLLPECLVIEETFMDWNKKNLIRVGDYFHSKRTEKNKNQCTSYFRNKIDEMKEKYPKGVEVGQCTSYFRNKIDEMKEKYGVEALGEEFKKLESEALGEEFKKLESEVNLYLDGQLLDEPKPESDWINFLKENNCEQFKFELNMSTSTRLVDLYANFVPYPSALDYQNCQSN